MRVLVVEDEPSLARSVAEGLRGEGMAVDVCHDGGTGWETATVHDYDVIVLDRDLPVLHGDRVCSRLAADPGVHARVLMLTAAGEVEDRVAGLDLGADDYLAKPFAYTELVARVRALGRRARPAAPPLLSAAGLEVDTVRRTAFRDGRELALSPKELGVLEELLRADGAPLSAVRLIEKVWDAHLDPFSGVLKVVVHGLRRRLGDPPVIETVPGQGYRIRAGAPE
ncbi:response regulator transcription factor [Nocardiopsis changdeensis]|uniref:Response regulator transcription factor n=1 Tax=Nocardiopsis changdeensis TaxID=2831969 RepID=A0ABX8BLU6_9ACTN|nr:MULTISPECIES: response regulator transcription factor [Nocardiopsis]QUX22705.1 response regulator transcription factor [Nocardiopsis changdeensis]QYX38648.1 response regulator transcription factor [Nocardiopsis sp. MT53]